MNANSAPDVSPNYLLLFRHTDWDRDLTVEQTREVMERVNAWFEDLARKGKALGGFPLLEHGKTVSSDQGKPLVTDGPFAESKEAVGGYLLLHAEDMDDAVAIASSSPLLILGVVTEVRELARECPILERIKEEVEASA